MRASSFLCGVTTVLVVGASTPAVAEDGALECGAVLHDDVVLQADLHCPGTALVVAGDGVTIDLAGHAVRFSGTGQAPLDVPALTALEDWSGGSAPQILGVQVQGGTIAGYGTAVSFGYTQGATVSRISTEGHVGFFRGGGSVLTDSTVGGASFSEGAGAGENAVRDSRVDGEIHLFEVGRVVIADNDLRPGPDQAGVASFYSSSTVEGNRIRGGRYGVRMSLSSGVVERNSVVGSGTGIVMFEAGGRVAGNRIVDAAAEGITYSSQAAIGDVPLVDNRVVSSGADGIRVFDSARPELARLGGNEVRASRGQGIDAPGVTDLGGNRARGNRVQPQCTGVVCR